MATEHAAAPSYQPQLDGLRAVAVLAVAWSHWERPYQFGIPFGVGVHLFYVLSGFLITRILLDIRVHANVLQAIRAFYVRRALRIFPAFYLTLALVIAADIPPVRETWAWHASYLSNVLVFVTREWPGSISHFWSLAVEEQFYLLWPWLIVFVPRRWIVPAIMLAIVAAPVFRFAIAWAGYRESLWSVLTPGCLDSLGVGALLAVWHGARVPQDTSSLAETAVGARLNDSRPQITAILSVVVLAYAGIIAAEAFGRSVPLAVVAIKQTLQAIVFGWIVWHAAEGFGGTAGRLLSLAPMVYVGRISYGIYLAHGFAGDILFKFGVVSREIVEPLRFLVLAGVTLGVAVVSWHLVEAPINRLKRHFPYHPRPHNPLTEHGPLAESEVRRSYV